MENNEKYLVDVAKDKVYQNQYEDYHEEFARWRSIKDNPYGYSFVHDTREHTYVDGEGYFQKTAESAERIALGKCLGLLGIVMLVMTLIDLLCYFVFYKAFNLPTAEQVYFSQVYNNSNSFSPVMTAVFGGMSLLKYLVGLWLFLHFTKIPTKVAVPMPKGSKISKSGLFLMLAVMVFGRVCNFLISSMLSWFNVDSIYALAIHNPDNIATDLIYIFFNCILVSIVSEILFRGAILQTFRQFGDIYAMLVSGIAYSLTCYDVSSMGFSVLCSTALCLYTIRTGSLKTTILMRVITAISSYLLACSTMENPSSGRLVEVCICAFVMIVTAFVFARLMCNGKWAFKIQDDPSQLSNGSKLRMLFTNTYTTVWMVAVIGMYVLTMRFL